MSRNDGKPTGPNVDEVLASVEGRADAAWRLRFAHMVSVADVMLTTAHDRLNDDRIYSADTDWSNLAKVANDVADAVSVACRQAGELVKLAESNANGAG